MKSRFKTAVLLSLLAFSFLLMVPVTTQASDLEEIPLGDISRIEFFDQVLKTVSDNDTIIGFTSNFLFDGKVAYITLNSSDSVTESSIYDEFYGMVYTGVKNGTDKIYLRTNASLNINEMNFTQDWYVHLLLWDEDKSLMNFIDKINDAIKAADGWALLDLVRDILDGTDNILVFSSSFLTGATLTFTYTTLTRLEMSLVLRLTW